MLSPVQSARHAGSNDVELATVSIEWLRKSIAFGCKWFFITAKTPPTEQAISQQSSSRRFSYQNAFIE